MVLCKNKPLPDTPSVSDPVDILIEGSERILRRKHDYSNIHLKFLTSKDLPDSPVDLKATKSIIFSSVEDYIEYLKSFLN